MEQKNDLVSRRGVLSAAFSAVKGVLAGEAIVGSRLVTGEPTDERKAFILEKMINQAYSTCVNRMARFMPDGWKPVETGLAKDQDLTLLNNVSPGLGSLAKITPEVLEISNSEADLKPPDEYPWSVLGKEDKIQVDEKTVFIYVPGGGGLVPEGNKSINDEVGWEKDLHAEIFKAKYGHNWEMVYSSFKSKMDSVTNYSQMLSVMSEYGCFFVPWNLVLNNDSDNPVLTPELNMTMQVFRLINTFKNKNVVLIGHSKGANVVQQMLKMVQERFVDQIMGSSKIVGALMYGRIVPPTQIAKMFKALNYTVHDIGESKIQGILELDELSTGIKSQELENLGVKTFDVFDPRDAVRFSPKLIKDLLNRKIDINSLMTETNLSIISLILKLNYGEVKKQLPNMDFTPFARIITRKGIPETDINSNLNAFIGLSGGRSEKYVDFHAKPNWREFLPLALQHID